MVSSRKYPCSFFSLQKRDSKNPGWVLRGGGGGGEGVGFQRFKKLKQCVTTLSKAKWEIFHVEG